MILDRYRAILLDLNGTFLFGEDRFGPTQDYHSIYRTLGGVGLSSDTLTLVIGECYDRMASLYSDPSCTERFPRVRQILDALPVCSPLPADEVELIERVFALHELGRVPEEYANAIHRLAATHRLGIVSNIWSDKSPWLGELERAGILARFEVVVFSSDGPSIKPSPLVFRQALDVLKLPSSAVVYVGDSLRCDVAGAASVGMDSIWINGKGVIRSSDSPCPNWEVPTLLSLAGEGD